MAYNGSNSSNYGGTILSFEGSASTISTSPFAGFLISMGVVGLLAW